MAVDPARLPARGGGPLLHPRIAPLWLRPWFDASALRFITHLHLPASRAWSRALEADGDAAAFAEALGLARVPGPLTRRALVATALAGRAHARAAAAWEAALFGPSAPDPAEAVRAEFARRRAAEAMMVKQGRFLPLIVGGGVEPVGWDIRAQAEMRARHAARLEGPAFPAPARGEIRRSHVVMGPDGPQYWLRVRAPSRLLEDEAWAHVYEPDGVENPATLVILHGICMEMEFWSDQFDPIPRLAGRGLRVVRVEGPWHGRRRQAGRYGGEPILARGPMGMVELLEAWVAEVALWIDWARRAGSGPVALSGISLGALASQLAISAARDWPRDMRPDAALLVVTTGDVGAILTDSALPRHLGLAPRIAEAGWTGEVLAPWLALAEPGPEPAVAPEDIVMLLGEVDTVAPHAGGRALAERWRIPAENRFFQRRGHFSASISLGVDARPVDRLLAALRRKGGVIREP